MTIEDLRRHIGRHLQAARKNAGYRSARAFADYMGISVNTYTGYEQGKSPFNIEQAWVFAEELRTSIDALVGFPAAAAFSDPGQTALNAYWESMNDKGRTALLNSAELMSGSPDTRIEKDRAEPSGVPAPVERSA